MANHHFSDENQQLKLNPPFQTHPCHSFPNLALHFFNLLVVSTQPWWPKLSSSTAVLTNPGSVVSHVAGHGHGLPYELW